MRPQGHCRTRDSGVKSRGRRLEGKLEGNGRLPRRGRKLQRSAGRREGQREGRRQPGQGRRRRVRGRALLRDSASRRSPRTPSIPTGPQEHTAGCELTGPLAHFREARPQFAGTASLARVQSLVARAWETAGSRFFSRPREVRRPGRYLFYCLGDSG